MRHRFSILRATCVGAVGAILIWRTIVHAGINYQGINYQGINYQGINYQGINYQGINYQGINYQGINYQGINYQGINYQGINYQGINYQGINYQGINYQGINYQGINYQGINYQGINYQGINYQGINYQGINYQGTLLWGVDRLGKAGPQVSFRYLELPNRTAPLGSTGAHAVLVPAPGSSMQGLQGATPSRLREISVDPAQVQLQAGPRPDQTGNGSYIFVPGLVNLADDPDGTKALTGTLWNGLLTDGNNTGAVTFYVASAERDSGTNASKYPSNDDVYLYSVYVLSPGSQEWLAACPTDDSGRPRAMAVPVNPFDRSTESRKHFTFACVASGVAAKCARNWGYKPWKSVGETVWNGAGFESMDIPLAPFYDACLIAAKADYCQDGASYTRNGTLVDLFDTLDGFTSINATSGLPYAPNSPGVMLHEEYQISALDLGSVATGTPHAHFVSENYSDPSSAPALTSSLRRSGMESSRYADRDPGRECAAAPYIDRCDPKEPYACYRSTNLSSQPYGAFLAVNSPRHCSHDELHDGEALDPLCNECVNRVCQIDPTCCGDPGSGFYPGSLVWDQRCTTIRNQVCRSEPTSLPPTDPSYLTGVWSPGATAPPAGSKPVVFLRGAIGAFEGFVCQGGTGADCAGGTWQAEGWSCDPDYPGTSNTVQISVGGQLGATGATLFTRTASEVLVPSWRETVAAECGGGGRHGFRFALPPGSAGKDVYVYGIDLDAPGAPFSLLRGGKKTVPASPPAAGTNPRAAIWTGWVEPTESGQYLFCKQQPGGAPGACMDSQFANPPDTDLYRLWVNGLYVAGNWTDDSTLPGAFTLDPPALYGNFPTQYLQKGVRYGVRVEYLRPSTLPSTSEFGLLWARDGATPTAVPASALYPMAQPSGNGLLGTYFRGALPNNVGNPSEQVATQTYGAVDYLWTGKNPPIVGLDQPALTGLSVNDTFAATFDGQVVPPISGNYVFSAEADGNVRIFVNDALASETANPLVADPMTCSHDICQPGAAISRTCREGSFCSSLICQSDPYCCGVTWDSGCVQKVTEVCHLRCDAAPPSAIPLQAGAKVQVRVEYQHFGGTPEVAAHGAKLRLMWALAGTLRDVVPLDRLFAAPVAAAPAQGVGLNAAYFSDATFQTEYLDRVEGPLAFSAAAAPGPARATSLICTTGSCAGPPLATAAPALVSVTSQSAVAGGLIRIAVVGRGVLDRAAVEVWEVQETSSGIVTVALRDSFNVPDLGTGVAGGAFEGGFFTHTIDLAKGAHKLAIRQTVDGVGSAWSPVLVFEAVDPGAPLPPTVATPVGGLVSGNGALQLGGQAAPGAIVTVSLGTTALGTFTADASGHWSGGITLSGVGNFALTVTAAVGGVPSASTTATVKVALPPLTVTTPAEGATITGPLSVSGSGATSSLGSVHIGDGDGRYFTDRGTVPVGPTGAFSGGSVSLDYGRHKIKVFQQSGGLDGDGVVRTVLVPPPAVDAATLSPANGTTVDARVTISGHGLARSGLPGTAVIYEGTTKIGEGPLDATGAFHVTVTVTGAGSQTIGVGQTASSLSGAGAAEGPLTPLMLVVKPPAPQIVLPLTGTTQDSLTLAVSGTAIPGANVTLVVDGTPEVTRPVLDDGTFAATLTLAAGTRRLTAFQTVGGAAGASTSEILVAVGDVTPPIVRADDPTCTTPPCAPLRKLVLGADSAGGAVANFASYVHAQDCFAGSCATLTATCQPPSGSTFAIGSTVVTCAATDSVGNVGTANFVVTVQSAAEPVFTATGLTVEAQSTAGAVVDYRITAEGSMADCAPPGSGQIQPCTSWAPAHRGLGFTPSAVAIDPNDPTVAADGKRHGALYAAFGEAAAVPVGNSPSPAHVLRSTDGGLTWVELASPPPSRNDISQIVVGAGSPPSLYLNSGPGPMGTLAREPTPGDGGLRFSHDGGQTWTSTLDTEAINLLAVDPADPLHMIAVAYRRTGAGATPMYETHDGWATYTPFSGDGLPGQRVAALAIDPFNPGRIYASVEPGASDLVATKLYRKLGAAPWQRLDVPNYSEVLGISPVNISIAPTIEPGQSYATVIAGPVISRDGGGTWLPTFLGGIEAVVFDRQNPQTIYVGTGGNVFLSTDGGTTFNGTSFFSAPVGFAVVQDAAEPQTLYSAMPNMGLYKTSDGAQSWRYLGAQGISLPQVLIRDVAFDPASAGRSYLLAMQGGVFRNEPTPDGLDAWVARNNGILDPFATNEQALIHVDAINRNNVFVTGFGGWWQSPNQAGDWTQLLSSKVLDMDDLLPTTAYAIDTSEGFLVFKYTPAVHPPINLSSIGGSLLGGLRIQHIPIPDADLHFVSIEGGFTGGGPRTVLFDPNVHPSGNPYAVAIQDPGINTAHVTLDTSQGQASLLFAGSAIGQSANALYRMSFDGTALEPAERVGAIAAQTDFHRVLIDPGTSGQALYALGSESPASNAFNKLWESHDGGATWQMDASTPDSLNHIWMSPVDGAVYGTVYPFPIGNQLGSDPDFWPGMLWKRTLAAIAPPGARVVDANLRVTCTGNTPGGITPGSTFPIGTTSITCSATDAFGRRFSHTYNIVVRDSTPPTLVVPDVISAGVNAGESYALEYDPEDISATDTIDGTVPVTCLPPAGTPLGIGVTTATCSATDNAGNTARRSITVVVFDASGSAPALPTLTVPDDTTVEADRPEGAAVTLSVQATTASGAPLTPNCSPALDSIFLLGTTTVTCSVTDGGVTIERRFAVTVEDTEPPALNVPADIVTTSDQPWGARVSYAVTASDVGASLTPSCVPASGSAFPLGTTTVSCQAVDKVGHRVTKSFHVTVNGLPPTLVVSDVTVEAEDQLGARVYYDPAPRAFDTAGNPATVDCTPATGTWFPMHDTTVSCVARDADLRETRGSFVVHVTDTLAPELVVPGTITAEAAGPNGTTVAFAVTASDMVDGVCAAGRPCGAPTCVRVTNTGVPVPVTSPALFPVGDTPITCTVTDSAGNSGSGTFSVLVRDTTPPVVTVADVNASSDSTDTALVAAFPVSATDIVSGTLPVACTPPPGSRFLLGTTRVSCTARDAAGNAAAAAFNVIVSGSMVGRPCDSPAACGGSLFCVDGVCCQTACGGGDPNDCQACSVAMGAAVNGTCAPLASTHLCRASAGACDVAETCNGSSVLCPADGFAPATSICRPSAGVCDTAETCTGTSAACPPDALTASGTTCRSSAGPCDVAEVCTGASAACPADAFASAGTSCRPSAGACDVAEACTGTSASCPFDALAPAGTVCAAARNACESPGVCSGGAPACPGPTPIPGCAVDTEPPYFSNVPATITTYTSTTAGMVVTYTNPTATDAVDGVRPVTCEPASGSTFIVGTTTVTCTASDTTGHTASTTFDVKVVYQTPTDGTFFAQPINSDGSSIFKRGSTIAVKFQLQGASAGITNLVAHIYVAQISSGITGSYVEATSNAAPDGGNIFRYDPGANQYVYNLSTKPMAHGTWSIRVDLGDGVDHSIVVSLK